MKKSTLFLSVLATLPLAATASTIVGNPNSSVVVVDGAGVYVHSVKAYRCSSGYQLIPVDDTLDQWDAANITFDEADYCDVVVRLRWSPGGALEPVAVGGFDVLSIDSSGGAFAIELDESQGKARVP
jgi:hypothetical protein